jgi:hypothetical protein
MTEQDWTEIRRAVEAKAQAFKATTSNTSLWVGYREGAHDAFFLVRAEIEKRAALR